MERKILLTSIFITLGAVAFLSGYLLMPQINQRPTTNDQRLLTAQGGSFLERFNTDNIVISDSTPSILPLSSRKFISFVQPFSDSKKIVAVANTGDIVEIDTVKLTEKVVYTGQIDIVEAMLSSAGNAVIYSFYNTANNKSWVYQNLKTGESTGIEGELKSSAFSPDGSQAVYLINDTDGGEILIAKDGKIIKRALKTRLGAATVAWPSEDLISIVSYDKNGYGDLYTLTLEGALNKILSYQYDLSTRWPPLGEKIIFSGKDDTGHTQLFYKNTKNSDATVALDIATSASKCVWADEENVVCGITDKTQIRDEFYKINLTDGSKTLVATPNINLLVRELSLSRSGDALFVLNDIDDKLYGLKIRD